MAKKRGRKRKYKRYFDDPQEEAIVKFLKSDDKQEREKIYKEYLEYPFFKMTESIINRYRLHSYIMPTEELIDATLSHLHEKLDKFKPSKGKKAYSYYGTIIKNYALGNRIKERKEITRKESYELNSDYYTQDINFSYRIEADEDKNIMEEYFYQYLDIIKNVIEEDEKKDQNDSDKLSEDEITLGLAIIEVMEKWEQIFEEGSKKFNRLSVLSFIRNITGFSTKQIRDNMKNYKKLYYERKTEKIDNYFNLKTDG